MGFADRYFDKQLGFIPDIPYSPSEQLRYIVVIPAFCEPDLTKSLESLWNCRRPEGNIEVFIVINAPENAGEEVLNINRISAEKTYAWIARHYDPVMRFHIMEKPSLATRDAGVGLARKLGMDEAIYRFNLNDNPHGFILSFDADSKCDNDYFVAIDEEIHRHPGTKGFTVYFEHPLQGNEFTDQVYQAITDYELHLRYVNQFLRLAGFPYAHHTIGSCFGVRADVYTAQGGMNKKKGGEDFYFLHKIIPLGNFTDITTTRVIPSPRVSFRVPFGTGPAIGKYIDSDEPVLKTFAPECFLALRDFIGYIPLLYKAVTVDVTNIIDRLPPSLREFLLENQVIESLVEINANCGSPVTFNKRFYRWFDAFRIVKYLNYASVNYYPKIPVKEAARVFLSIRGHGEVTGKFGAQDLLKIFRRIERKNFPMRVHD